MCRVIPNVISIVGGRGGEVDGKHILACHVRIYKSQMYYIIVFNRFPRGQHGRKIHRYKYEYIVHLYRRSHNNTIIIFLGVLD